MRCQGLEAKSRFGLLSCVQIVALTTSVDKLQIVHNIMYFVLYSLLLTFFSKFPYLVVCFVIAKNI